MVLLWMQVVLQILGLGLTVMHAILVAYHFCKGCGMFCVVAVAMCAAVMVLKVLLRGDVFMICMDQRQSRTIALAWHVFALRFVVVVLFGVVAH